MSAEDNRGDLADQAEASIEADERAAIAAGLAGRQITLDDEDSARPDRIADEPPLDLGDPDDSDDELNAGGDDIGTSSSGAPAEGPDEDETALDAMDPEGDALEELPPLADD
jgi:hypothetical protein